jgi:hypothetical protein
MPTQYRTRVCERRFLNRPGHHAGAYVRAELEDTSGWAPTHSEKSGWSNPEPNVVLEIKDCTRSIYLEFDWATADSRRNSVYKLDTLIDALARFRAGLVEEQRLYVARGRPEDPGEGAEGRRAPPLRRQPMVASRRSRASSAGW